MKSYKGKKAKKFWDDILTVKEPLSEYDAKELENTVKKLRKEFNLVLVTKDKIFEKCDEIRAVVLGE